MYNYKYFRCNLKESQYKCPKCRLEYCSLTCFKDTKHSRCTERFYQDQVKESLKSEKISEFSDEHEKMMKILEKLRNLGAESDKESDDTSENESLMDALEEMNPEDLNDLSVEELEKLLGEKHLKKIEELIEQGVTKEWLLDSNIVKSGKSIDKPWFLRFKPSAVVLNEELPDYVPNCKAEDIPKLKSLTTKPASDFLWNNLVEISVIYSFIYQQFGVEEIEDEQVLVVEIVPVVLELCSTFQAKTFVSAVEALESAKSAIDFNSIDHDLNQILTGSINLFSHPKMLIIMLMDMQKWFTKAKNDRNAFLVVKKLVFLTAWLEAEVEASKGSVDEIFKMISSITEQFISE